MRQNETWTTFWSKWDGNGGKLPADEFGRDVYWHIIDPAHPEVENIVHEKGGVARFIAEYNNDTEETVGLFDCPPVAMLSKVLRGR